MYTYLYIYIYSWGWFITNYCWFLGLVDDRKCGRNFNIRLWQLNVPLFFLHWTCLKDRFSFSGISHISRPLGFLPLAFPWGSPSLAGGCFTESPPAATRMGAWPPQDKPRLVGSEIPSCVLFASQKCPRRSKTRVLRWKAPSKDSKAHVPLFNLVWVWIPAGPSYVFFCNATKERSRFECGERVTFS
jgi:hypothetical protein